VYYNAFGYVDCEAKKPMDRNMIVRIFSMTKPVTGVALMTLYEKGKFELDDPLSKYVRLLFVILHVIRQDLQPPILLFWIRCK